MTDYNAYRFHYDIITEGYRCPNCDTKLGALEHGVEVRCPGCGARVVRHANCLKIEAMATPATPPCCCHTCPRRP